MPSRLRICFERRRLRAHSAASVSIRRSANTQAGLSGNVQHGRGSLLFFGNFGGRRTGDYDAPDETIPNSATRLVTGEGGFGWNGSRAYFGLSAGFERNRYGIPFAGLLEGEEDAEIDLDMHTAKCQV